MDAFAGMSRVRFLLALLLVGCGGGDVVTAPETPELSLNAMAWTFRYSPGMPGHPSPAIGGGWQFDFPAQDGLVLHGELRALALARSVGFMLPERDRHRDPVPPPKGSNSTGPPE